jgi:methyl-accepting chemotaxis protein
VSKIDELAELISGLANRIDEATAESSGTAQQAEEIAATAEALGAQSLVEGMAAVKEQLDSLSDTLKGASERALEIQALALSVAEGG